MLKINADGSRDPAPEFPITANEVVKRNPVVVPNVYLTFQPNVPFEGPDGSSHTADERVYVGPIDPKTGKLFSGASAGTVLILPSADGDAIFMSTPNTPMELSTSTPDQIRAYAASFSDPSAKATALLTIACSLVSLLNQSPASAPAPAPVTNQSLGLGGTPPPPQGFGPSTIEPGFQANPTT